MRAASWLREGRRPAEEGLSAFERSGRSGLGCGAADEFAFMARVDRYGRSSQESATASLTG